jgi:hypothetical protein
VGVEFTIKKASVYVMGAFTSIAWKSSSTRMNFSDLFSCRDNVGSHARLHPLETIFQSGEGESIFDLPA